VTQSVTRLLRLRDVARFLDVSPERARQLHHAGGLPSPIAVDHHGSFWPRDVIESWAEREWWDTRPWRKRL
jgi:predicted DNA-binding transcriptional regulator AlpA